MLNGGYNAFKELKERRAKPPPPSVGPAPGAGLPPVTITDAVRSSKLGYVGAKLGHVGSTLDHFSPLMSSLWSKKSMKATPLKNITKKYCHDTLQDLKK